MVGNFYFTHSMSDSSNLLDLYLSTYQAYIFRVQVMSSEVIHKSSSMTVK
jgi:hypothetical protein